MDLSSTTDLTAFVLVFPPLDDEDKFQVLPYFWLSEETIDLRVRKDHVPYDLWSRQGLLNTTEGSVIHYSFVEKFIARLSAKFNILAQNLEEQGFTMVQFGQGWSSLSPPTKELMNMTLEKRIAHDEPPCSSLEYKLSKKKLNEKTDGVFALIMALDRAI